MSKRTVGISNKLIQTLLGACGAQLVAFAVNWVSSGEFDRVELAQLVGLAGTALVGFAVGYQAEPDPVGINVDSEGGFSAVEAIVVGFFALLIAILLLYFLPEHR